MAKLHGEVFSFGEFVLAPQERLLLRAGRPVALTRKALDLLIVLVRQSGHLVTKGELLDAVWPGVAVEEVNLTVNISALRKALAVGGAEVAIETVPRYGYRFTGHVRAERESAPAVLSDAVRAYLQGRHEWNQRTAASLRRAIEHFSAALAIDAGLAAAHSGLADCHATLGYLSHCPPRDAFPQARRHADRALVLDDGLAEAHASLGFIRLYFDWDQRGAEAAFQRAIELDPDHAPSHQWLATCLLANGQPEAAWQEISLAHRREPLSAAINGDLGFHLYYTGRYPEALKQLAFTQQLNPDFAPTYLWLGRTLQELGRLDEAIAAFRQLEQRVGHWPVAIAARGFVEGKAGRATEAHQTLSTLLALRRRRFVTAYGIALVHAGLNDADAAFAALDQAVAERSNWLVWLRQDPRWARLRDDVRFATLLRKVTACAPLSAALPSVPKA
jgi:DNA-binding winged helix-turn-helix (wHTH) protein